ncbi:ATP-binding cassette sub-family A member 1 [Elysia marginata]|uniref:ATP-binding cassette sub-family A member 1 n=1 Tax=Elysia marginata TaxID=1093978 RepID=A0AAV4EFX2_9GAST|nr:ATP-binding cassette sub-family A member 1 [Elysia marginata]
MAQGLRLIGNYEIQTIGAQWYNIHKCPGQHGQFSLLICIAMMFLDSFVLILITTYIDHVFPGNSLYGKYGIASPWNFFAQKSYWTGAKAVARNISVYDRQTSMTHYYGRRGSYERHKIRTKIGVAVRDLTKLYKGADKPAVDKLSLNFYEGQITSFLGHNGAGKTTTLTIPEPDESGRRETLGSRASVTSKWLVELRPQRPGSDIRTVNAMRVTAGLTVCCQRRPVCSTRTLRQVTTGRRENPDPQQQGSVRRVSGCQEEGHLTRTANVDRSDVNSKGGLKLPHS